MEQATALKPSKVVDEISYLWTARFIDCRGDTANE